MLTIFLFFVWGYVKDCLFASQSVEGSQRSNFFLQTPEVWLATRFSRKHALTEMRLMRVPARHGTIHLVAHTSHKWASGAAIFCQQVRIHRTLSLVYCVSGALLQRWGGRWGLGWERCRVEGRDASERYDDD